MDMDISRHNLEYNSLEIEGNIDGVDANFAIHGWVRCRGCPSIPLMVGIYEKDAKLLEQRACLLREDLAKAGLGDGHFGLCTALPRYLFDGLYQYHSLQLQAAIGETPRLFNTFDLPSVSPECNTSSRREAAEEIRGSPRRPRSDSEDGDPRWRLLSAFIPEGETRWTRTVA